MRSHLFILSSMSLALGDISVKILLGEISETFLPRCPRVNEWIKELWYIYTMEFYAAERKKELLPFVTEWMELESTMLREISQVVKDKYHMISPLTGT